MDLCYLFRLLALLDRTDLHHLEDLEALWDHLHLLDRSDRPHLSNLLTLLDPWLLLDQSDLLLCYLLRSVLWVLLDLRVLWVLLALQWLSRLQLALLDLRGLLVRLVHQHQYYLPDLPDQ